MHRGRLGAARPYGPIVRTAGLARALTSALGLAVACVLAGCGSATEEAAATPTATLTRHDEGALPSAWPPEASPGHGDEVWAVYLAIGAAGDPELADAAQYLRDRGYSTFDDRELGCDVGAAEALARDRHELAVAAYFQWRPDATDFLSLLKPAQGATPETTRSFIELLPVRWDCVR